MNKSNDRSNNEVEKFFCDNCEERIVFNLKQGDKYFHLPLSKMLECLLIAEAEGEVPMIDDDWCLYERLQIKNRLKNSISC